MTVPSELKHQKGLGAKRDREKARGSCCGCCIMATGAEVLAAQPSTIHYSGFFLAFNISASTTQP